MKGLKIETSKDKEKKKKALLLAGFLLFIAITMSFSPKITNLFYCISSPVQRSLNPLGKGISTLTSVFWDTEKLKERIQVLEKERQEMAAEIFLLREHERENEILREALDLGLDDFKLILAGVSGFDPTGDSLLIDKGSKDGISAGMPVITSKKVIIGRTHQVYEHFSRIMVVSHKDSPFFDVRVQGGETIGVAKGEGRFNLSLDFISKEDEIKEGAGVVSMGKVFPGGLLIGRIGEIKESDAQPFREVEIKLLFDPRRLEKVFIIKDYQE